MIGFIKEKKKATNLTIKFCTYNHQQKHVVAI